ncbi:MAG: MnmC family methyltransferase [Cyanobacteriota bacterium]|nr:MnmC family methyltransferase [Cyanobacteriota bacterium]
MTGISEDTPPLRMVETGDGSLTFYSEQFGQALHNLSGARQEALEKFALPCLLPQLAAEQVEIHLLDVCFGLGYNTGVALETIWQVAPACRVISIGLENDPAVVQQAHQVGIRFGQGSEGEDWQAEWQRWLEAGEIFTPRWQGSLKWGDARQTILQVPLAWADAVFLDPFSPSVCPELWTVDFLTEIARRLKPQARLATYSCGAAVRSALQEAGLQIGSTPPVGRPWPGTVACWPGTDLPPLSPAEQEHLQTKAAVPYRDPTLRQTREQIRLARQQEQQRSSLEATSAWKKRWQSQGIPTC